MICVNETYFLAEWREPHYTGKLQYECIMRHANPSVDYTRMCKWEASHKNGSASITISHHKANNSTFDCGGFNAFPGKYHPFMHNCVSRGLWDTRRGIQSCLCIPEQKAIRNRSVICLYLRAWPTLICQFTASASHSNYYLITKKGNIIVRISLLFCLYFHRRAIQHLCVPFL